MDKQVKLELFDTCPVVICVADPSKDKIIYSNQEAISLIGNNWESLSLSSIFSSSREISEYISNFSLNSKKLTCGHTINGKWIIFSLLPFKKEESSFITITGTEITGLIYEGYFDLSKTKDPFTGIYDKNSGLEYLEGFLGSPKESHSPLFTLSYMKLGCSGISDTNKYESHIIKFVHTASSSIRETDIFASMGDDTFIIIFPKCPVSVVENIMATIKNKLDFINNVEDSPYDLKIKYSILEVNEKNNDDSVSILMKAKSMLN